MPDTPPVRSDKQKEVERDDNAPSWLAAAGPVPPYHESTEGSSLLTTSWNPQPPPLSPTTESSHAAERAETDASFEEEYDGYEDMSTALSALAPPPAIDEDVSPPSPSASGSSGPANAFNSLDLDNDGPPPPLLSEYDGRDSPLITTGAFGGGNLQFFPLGTTSSPSIPSSPVSAAGTSGGTASGPESSPLVLRPIYADNSGNNEDVPIHLYAASTSRSGSADRSRMARAREQGQALDEQGLPPPYAGARGSLSNAGLDDDENMRDRDRAGGRRGNRRAGSATEESDADDENDGDDDAGGPPPEYSSHHAGPQEGHVQRVELVGVVRDGELVGVLEQVQHR